MSHCAQPRIAPEIAVMRADRADEHLRIVRCAFHSGAQRAIEIDAGGDHRGGVDQRGDRRRAFHRVGKPGVQRHLRRFRGAADEQRDADREQQRRCRTCRRRRKASPKPIEPMFATITKIANMMPTSPTTLMTNALRAAATAEGRSNQNPIRKYDARPTRPQPTSKPDEVVGEHQREHREDEEIHVGEEARERAVAVHVADRVDDGSGSRRR